ncbi:ABC transporter ATP-binding protein [Mesomycoplasma lagogenitalium]|uniref:ABC transporter ATP-binding protein n=1 Tax=Mesomycoplasma lagogenitalium TaxID=171286 RepID=A0ABY8LWC5_9BACT|nr:ABC transporter ATP-binding protein [Mesomycoplasma lagogenitalium]WGI36853.1 ABC transporter ATP-binding protein [Mesomycoplasma lagogenitalium]
MTKYFKNAKLLLFFAIVVSLIAVALPSVLIYFISIFIDNVTLNKITDFENNSIIIIAILGVLSILFLYLSYFLKDKLKMKFNVQLNKNITNVISNLSSKEVETNKSGTYLFWLKQRSQIISQTIFDLGFTFINMSFSLLFSLIVLFFLSWKIALIGLSITIVCAFIPLFLSSLAGNLHAKFNDESEKNISSLKNCFDSFMMLYYLNKEDKFTERANQIFEKNLNLVKTKQNKVILLEIINSSFLLIADISFFIVLGYYIYYENAGIGLLFTIPSVFSTLIYFFRITIYFFQQYVSTKEYIKLFADVKEHKIENKLLEFNKLEIKDLHFNYEDKQIIKNFNFVFEKGKKYAIIGPSGSGKSTFLKILLKEIEEYQGKILVNNQDLKNVDLKVWKNSFTYLDSKDFIFNDTVYNNVSLWEENKFEKVKEALIKVNLKNVDINDNVDKIINLSTGERQKINFARHFFRDKKVLFLDEALANLDKENVINIENLLLEDPSLTLINVTHHLKEPQKYDYVINLEDLWN